MSEDEHVRITAQDEEQDEVEAHGRHSLTAQDEESEGEDDFEAHRAPKMNRPGRTA